MAVHKIEKKLLQPETETQISRFQRFLKVKSNFTAYILLESLNFDVKEQTMEKIVLNISNNKLEILGKGKNSLCYKTKISDKTGELIDIAVKTRIINPKTNPDMTFENEALALKKINPINIGNSQKMFFRFEKDGKYYLVTNIVRGIHPHCMENPFTPIHLDIILNHCFELDKNYFLHSDLKARNLLTGENHVGLIDFEFTNHIEKNAILKVLSRQNKEFCCDYNVCSNPYFLIRSNLSNFEFRTLYKYINDINKAFSEEKADEFFVCYLKKKSKYHEKWANFIEETGVNNISEMADYGHISIAKAEEIIYKAVNHERIAAKILANPDKEIIGTEFAKIYLRYAVFENNYNNRIPDIRELYLNAYKKFKIAVENNKNAGLKDKVEFLINNLETMKMFYRIVKF